MSILLTGSEGYVGSHLKKIMPCDLFDLKLGHDIRTLDYNLNHNVVIHLAALVQVGESVKNPINYYTTNVFGTLNLLKHCKPRHFIFASTGAAEQPNSPYALSKLAAEQIVTQYCKENNINYTIFRFYNVIGCDPDVQLTNEDGLVYALKQSTETGVFNLYGSDYDTPDGTAIRDYVHVHEICESIKSCIINPSNSIECLGHGKCHSVKEIVNIFKKVNGVDFTVKYTDRRSGDLERSVLNHVSKYMTSKYAIEEMLKL
jgi:UDP-glucose 4-epimerase